jgi:hypothetical protein
MGLGVGASSGRARQGLQVARVRELRCGPTSSVAAIGPGSAAVELPGVPDARSADAAALGLRRLHSVVFDVREAAVSCVVSGATRMPVRRQVALGGALAMVQRGVPGYVVLPGT